MRLDPRALALLAAAPLLLAVAPIRFLEPLPGATRTRMPQHVVLDFDAGADAQTLVVQLNGIDVTSHFAIGDPSGGRRVASADHVWEDAVLPGPNTLTASIDLGGSPQDASRDFRTVGDPYADAVVRIEPGADGGFNAGALPAIVLGAPAGEGLFQGGLDVYSLGRGGSIELRFTDNRIVDGPGVDFTVFENAFLELGAGNITQPPFAEPAVVKVSQNGADWVAFPCVLDEIEGPPYWPGCAGVYPVLSDGTSATPHASVPTSTPIQDLVGLHILSLPTPEGAGGDSYDLADVGLAWASHVRIEAAGFDTGPVGTNNAAFDLDAVAAVNSVPVYPVPALAGAGRAALAALLAALAGVAVRAGRGRS